ncbi:MAG: hypothetical protein KatS3mg015_1158 [Fimbriimonadales bacterium]|nr:MAG: hypothetical protein KatS3mg015_1158 [Fimbriimonadales bacterium]
MLALAVWGCGSPPPPPPPVADEPTSDRPVLEGTEFEKVEIVAQTDQGETLWRIRADRGTGTLSEDNAQTDLRNVEATLYQKEEPAVVLIGSTGRADEKAGEIAVEGNVRARAVDGSASLSCDRIKWNRDARLLSAYGNVTGRLGTLSFDSADQVRARFDNKEGDVKGTSLMLVSAFVIGQGVTFRSPEVELDAKSLTARYADNRTRLVWEGSGTPFRAYWKAQDLTVTGSNFRITQSVRQEGGREVLALQSGVFSGNVSARWTPAGDTVTLTGLSEWTVTVQQQERRWNAAGKGAPIRFESKANNLKATGATLSSQGTLDARGGATAMAVEKLSLTNATVDLQLQDGPATLRNLNDFTLTQTNGAWQAVGTGNRLQIEYPAREFMLLAAKATLKGVTGQNPGAYEWQTADLEGNVEAVVVVTQGDQKQRLRATAPSASLDRQAAILTLSGGVTLSGNLTLLGGGETTVTSPSIRVQFDPTLTQVVRIEMSTP